MAQVKNLIAKWGAAWPSPMIISRQYDNGQYRIDLFNYPEPEHIVDEQTEQMEVLSYYLIVWMKETEDGEYREMSPIMLPGPYWIVPNQYTQLVQDIRFQFCVQSDSTDYEAHSAIFTGRIVDSIEHDGDPVDVTPAEMFDAYKAYVNDLIVAAGDVQIDTSLSVSGAAADAKAVGDALSSTNERLDEITTEVEAETATETNVASVTFTDATGGKNITSLQATLAFTQSGSGDPSDENVRPITGVSAVEVTNSGTETDIYFVDENDDAVTVYGGTVDLVTGEATITWVCATLTGANVSDVSQTSSGRKYASLNIPKLMKSGTDTSSKSDRFIFDNAYAYGHMRLPSYSTTKVWAFKDSFTTMAAAQEYFNSNPVQLCYQIKNPYTVQLQGTQLQTKQGENIITVDSGNFSITYETTSAGTVLNDALGLTEQMGEEVDEKIAESAPDVSGQIAVKIADASVLSTDAYLYLAELPDYYKSRAASPASYDEAYSYMERRIKAIPDPANSFVFITDTHWTGNTKHSTQMINYIRKRTGIRKVLFGGDIKGNADTKYLFVRDGGDYLMQSRQAFGLDYIPCVGDHDHNSVSVAHDDTHFVSYEAVHEMFMGDIKRIYHPYDPVEKLAEFTTDPALTAECLAFFHTVYYVDDIERNTRFIVLNCGNAAYYGAMQDVFGETGTPLLRLQYDWFADTLMSTPTGMNICVLSHKANQGSPSPDIIIDILSMFARKSSSYSPRPASSTEAVERWWSHNTKTYNFSNAPDVGFVFSIDGHLHDDRIMWTGSDGTAYQKKVTYDGTTVLNQKTLGQIPLITTTCDSIGTVASTYREAMVSGTVTEQAFDIVTIEDDGISFTRFGVGSDRKVYISKEA